MVTVKSHVRKTKSGQIRVASHRRRKKSLPTKQSKFFEEHYSAKEIYKTPVGAMLIEIKTRWNPDKQKYEFFHGLTDLEVDPFGAPLESKKGFRNAEDALADARKQIKTALSDMKKASKTDMFVYADYLGGDPFLTFLKNKNLRTDDLTQTQIDIEFKKFKKGE